MTEEIKEILDTPIFIIDNEGFTVYINDKINDYITNLQKENTDLKKLCDKYEEEHKTTFETWKKVIARNEKAIEKLGKYKHYTTPTEEQNSENEDIVDSAYNILQGGDE